jgi:membrane-associated protease RseP (regulator of RpoE activity)
VRPEGTVERAPSPWPLLAILAAFVVLSVVTNQIGVFLFAVLILFSIGLHEFGHFITAKKFGIKVEQFFIGFGPKLWSFRRGETEYGVKAIPAGGFVRIAGMNPYEEVPEEDRNRTFKSRKPWQRAIVLAAGSFMHFILALGIIAAILATAGVRDFDKPLTTIEAVLPKTDAGVVTPAAQAGLSHGDKIVAIDGVPIRDWTQMHELIASRGGQEIAITYQRGRFERTTKVRLAYTTDKAGKRVGFLGVQPAYAVKHYGPISAVGEAGGQLGEGIVASFKAFAHLFSPSSITHIFQVAFQGKPRKVTDPATVVGVGSQAGGLAREGNFAGFFYLIAGVNIFIGVANLMPLPPLDGGHLAVLAYEKIRRRDVDMRRLIPISAAVISVLGAIFLILLYTDIVRGIPGIPG